MIFSEDKNYKLHYFTNWLFSKNLTYPLQGTVSGKLTSSKWATIAKCSQDNALRDIQDLIMKKILVEEGERDI